MLGEPGVAGEVAALDLVAGGGDAPEQASGTVERSWLNSFDSRERGGTSEQVQQDRSDDGTDAQHDDQRPGRPSRAGQR